MSHVLPKFVVKLDHSSRALLSKANYFTALHVRTQTYFTAMLLKICSKQLRWYQMNTS